jgi:hypothetical protein
MKTLETTFVSGVGGFSQNPLTYTQVIRNDKAAVYERSWNGKPKDYEVFEIQVLPKGHQIFQQVLEDDEERYPSTGKFGFSAWSYGNKYGAMRRYQEIIDGKVAVLAPEVEPEDDHEATPSVTRTRTPKPEVSLNIPVGEFTTKILAAHNNVDYSVASPWLKTAIANNQVKFLRKQTGSGRGKPSSVFIKA